MDLPDGKRILHAANSKTQSPPSPPAFQACFWVAPFETVHLATVLGNQNVPGSIRAPRVLTGALAGQFSFHAAIRIRSVVANAGHRRLDADGEENSV
jgi:hypothetical protein